MSLKLKKSFKIAPGVKVNIGKKSSSLTMGVRGASINTGTRGTYINAGLPNTGISVRKKISTSPSYKTELNQTHQLDSVDIQLTNNGHIQFLNKKGELVPKKEEKAIKAQNREALLRFIRDKCDEINSPLNKILELHKSTRSPNKRICYHKNEFSSHKPSLPKKRKEGILCFISKAYKEKTKRYNESSFKEYEKKLVTWQKEKELFDKNEREKQGYIERNEEIAESTLSELTSDIISSIDPPLKTSFSYKHTPNSNHIKLEIELSKIEAIQQKKAYPTTNIKISFKKTTSTELRKIYIQYVYSIIFKSVGDLFYNLPPLQKISVSAYTKETNPNIENTKSYIISARISRDKWSKIDFRKLNNIDIIDTFSIFETKSKITKTGIIKTITPLE